MVEQMLRDVEGSPPKPCCRSTYLVRAALLVHWLDPVQRTFQP